MRDRNRNIDEDQVRDWVSKATDEELEDFLSCGLGDLIFELEQDDFFGTEGFNKRLG